MSAACRVGSPLSIFTFGFRARLGFFWAISSFFLHPSWLPRHVARKTTSIPTSRRLTRAAELFYRRRTLFDHVEYRSQAVRPREYPRNGPRLLCLGPGGGLG